MTILILDRFNFVEGFFVFFLEMVAEDCFESLEVDGTAIKFDLVDKPFFTCFLTNLLTCFLDTLDFFVGFVFLKCKFDLMDEFDKADKSEIMRREQLQNQIDELSKDDPFYSILTKKTISNADLESCKNV